MKIPVDSKMSHPLITINKKESPLTAYKLLMAHNIRHLPVIDENGDICGMISDRDIQRAMTSDFQKSSDIKLETLTFQPGKHVADYMVWQPKTVPVNTDILDVAHALLVEKASALLVTDGHNVVGIITTDDLLKVLIGILEKSETSKLTDFFSAGFIGRLAQTASDAGI